jgi:hypothetical protein
VQAPHRLHLASPDAAARTCADWYRALDAALVRARASEASPARIAGFPYLRVDRFTASFSDKARDNDAAYEAWVQRLAALDRDARRFEIANLPDAEATALGGDPEALRARADECRVLLMQADLADPATRALLWQRARVPDDYRGWQRALGLYPLTRLPFYAGVKRWQRETEESFRRPLAGRLPVQPVIRYRPEHGAVYTADGLADLFARAERDALGVPQFDDAELARLLLTFAPVFEVQTADDHDRIGRLRWAAGHAPEVDLSQPVVYTRLAHARDGERTLVQLVYLAWFPERPKDHAFDLLGGHLDGVIWRVTLAPDGEPLLYDTIHPCGCFHMFFPTPRIGPLPPPARTLEWAFVPLALPRVAEPFRLALGVQARTHYIRAVIVDREGDNAGESLVYAFEDYDTLRSLPLGDGARSAFLPNGLIPGTQRGERFFFWPMGVPSAGAMRQWGTHATAFVGRRHFDDPDLIEKRFRLRD